MKRICFIFICLLLSYFQVLIVNAQPLDTVYFSCDFGRMGIHTKNIVIHDLNNDLTHIIDNYHGRKGLPIKFVINNNTDTLLILINERFKINKPIVVLRKEEIQGKYIRLWRNHKKEFEFSYSNRLFSHQNKRLINFRFFSIKDRKK